jgi:membrane protein implicated in regulation of membrane protease activity
MGVFKMKELEGIAQEASNLSVDLSYIPMYIGIAGMVVVSAVLAYFVPKWRKNWERKELKDNWRNNYQ